MRISDKATYDAVRRNVSRAQQSFLKAQEQASTGLRVSKPSDDPVAAAQARREASRKALGDAGMAAADQAMSSLEGADLAIDDVYEGLTRARELALGAANTTVSTENRRAYAEEVRKIREQMVSLGNTNVGGKYVFAGYRDQTPPFQADGSFVGDGATKEVQALPGLRVSASVSGAAIFGNGSSDDAFSTLDSLINALESDDTDAIRETLTGLQTNQDRVLRARSQIGGMMDSVELARNVADRQQYRATTEIHKLIEVDEISAATDLLQAKSALEAALAVAQQIPTGLAGRG